MIVKTHNLIDKSRWQDTEKAENRCVSFVLVIWLDNWLAPDSDSDFFFIGGSRKEALNTYLSNV